MQFLINKESGVKWESIILCRLTVGSGVHSRTPDIADVHVQNPIPINPPRPTSLFPFFRPLRASQAERHLRHDILVALKLVIRVFSVRFIEPEVLTLCVNKLMFPLPLQLLNPEQILTIDSVPTHVQERLAVNGGYPDCTAQSLTTCHDEVTPDQYPPTPRLPCVDLPPEGPVAEFPGGVQMMRRRSPTLLFPIDLEKPGLSSTSTMILTDRIPAMTNISVRNIENRVLCEVNIGSAAGMNTADFVEFLQHLAQKTLDSYSDISPPTQELHKAARGVRTVAIGPFVIYSGFEFAPFSYLPKIYVPYMVLNVVQISYPTSRRGLVGTSAGLIEAPVSSNNFARARGGARFTTLDQFLVMHLLWHARRLSAPQPHLGETRSWSHCPIRILSNDSVMLITTIFTLNSSPYLGIRSAMRVLLSSSSPSGPGEPKRPRIKQNHPPQSSRLPAPHRMNAPTTTVAPSWTPQFLQSLYEFLDEWVTVLEENATARRPRFPFHPTPQTTTFHWVDSPPSSQTSSESPPQLILPVPQSFELLLESGQVRPPSPSSKGPGYFAASGVNRRGSGVNLALTRHKVRQLTEYAANPRFLVHFSPAHM
ncbi:hypothetical protein FB45DRAFT_1116967 [Roridomyces roridus]|uniref:Uncharacterized protein n=1 Tax=Roridomyces roridus TaxID=1738132 RepID=A0AAD7CEQ6_9AGAR|nr:hypothetical protein FB45DRAFT_1116967 [Roridomyces roridus]